MHMCTCLQAGFIYLSGVKSASTLVRPVLGSECAAPGELIIEKPGLGGGEKPHEGLGSLPEEVTG